MENIVRISPGVTYDERHVATAATPRAPGPCLSFIPQSQSAVEERLSSRAS